MNIYILGYLFLFQSIRCLQSLYVVWIYEAVYSKILDWSGWSLNMTHGFNDLFNNPVVDFSYSFGIIKWPKYITRWWFQIFFIFIPTWGRFPFWLFFSNGLKPTTRSDWWNTVACGYIVHPNKVSFRQNPWRSLVDWWLGPPKGESSVAVGKKGPWFFLPTGKGHAIKVCKQQIDTHWFFLICFYILLLSWSLYIGYCYYVFLHYVCSCFILWFLCVFAVWFHIHVFICCFCVSSDLFVQLFVKRTNTWGSRIWFGGGNSCSSIETAMFANWILKDHRQLSAQTTAKTNTPC